MRASMGDNRHRGKPSGTLGALFGALAALGGACAKNVAPPVPPASPEAPASPASPARLRIGDAAPGIGLPSHGGVPISLRDFKGRKVLVWFYPAADTPG